MASASGKGKGVLLLIMLLSGLSSLSPRGFASGENITDEMNGDIGDCINQTQDRYSQTQFSPGTLEVIFRSVSTEKEATDAVLWLQSYNFSIQSNRFPDVTIGVVEGSEIEWKCILESNDMVESVVLTMYGVSSDEAKILNAFETKIRIPLLVRLHDNSGVIKLPEDSREELLEKSRQINEWFQPMIASVLETIPRSEIELIGRRFNGFDAYLTKGGFELLLNDSRVREIVMVPEEGNPSISTENATLETNMTSGVDVTENGTLNNGMKKGGGEDSTIESSTGHVPRALGVSILVICILSGLILLLRRGWFKSH